MDDFIVDKKLLSILVCRASGLAYPISEGIPVMLESEARQLTADEKLRDSGK